MSCGCDWAEPSHPPSSCVCVRLFHWVRAGLGGRQRHPDGCPVGVTFPFSGEPVSLRVCCHSPPPGTANSTQPNKILRPRQTLLPTSPHLHFCRWSNHPPTASGTKPRRFPSFFFLNTLSDLSAISSVPLPKPLSNPTGFSTSTAVFFPTWTVASSLGALPLFLPPASIPSHHLAKARGIL